MTGSTVDESRVSAGERRTHVPPEGAFGSESLNVSVVAEGRIGSVGNNGALTTKEKELKTYFKLVDDISNYIARCVDCFSGIVQRRLGQPPNPADLPIENNGGIALQIRHVHDGSIIMLLTPLGALPVVRGGISPQAIVSLKRELKLESILPDRQSPIFSVRAAPGILEGTLPLARIKRKAPTSETISKGLAVWNEIKPQVEQK